MSGSKSWLVPFLLFLVVVVSGRELSADEIENMFEAPSTKTLPREDKESDNLLSQYQKTQERLAVSFDLSAGAGEYAGYTGIPDLSNLIQGLGHSSVGGFLLSPAIDARPFEYLRLHGSFSLFYPTVDSTTTNLPRPYIFGRSLKELFLDYAFPALVSVRMGRFSTSWGNARILGVADLANRGVDISSLEPLATILPSWLRAVTPSQWLKVTIPFDPVGLTLLVGLPSNESEGVSSMGYGALVESVRGNAYFALSGYYKRDLTPRVALMTKASALGIDLFLDSTIAFRTNGDPLIDAVAGLYYQTSSTMDLKVTAELRWNGENDPITGSPLPDALTIGGLSHALAVSWGNIGGSKISAGGTWYHAWADGSGAICPAITFDMGRLVSLRAVLACVYGGKGSLYYKNPPSEANGYYLGGGIVVAIKTDF